MKGKNFILCGFAGWCIEVAFTSLNALRKKDKKLMGQTSAWMFPIYGLASFISVIYPKIKHWNIALRGILYGCSIMTVEFLSGSLLKRLGICPWNYDGCRFSIKGLIRMDFLPLWIGAGIFYEQFLLAINDQKK